MRIHGETKIAMAATIRTLIAEDENRKQCRALSRRGLAFARALLHISGCSSIPRMTLRSSRWITYRRAAACKPQYD